MYNDIGYPLKICRMVVISALHDTEEVSIILKLYWSFLLSCALYKDSSYSCSTSLGIEVFSSKAMTIFCVSSFHRQYPLRQYPIINIG